MTQITGPLSPQLADKGYRISSDRRDIDLDTVHRFLCDEAYWSQGIGRKIVAKGISNSMCFSVLHRLDSDAKEMLVTKAVARESQVGFARVITDRASFAYLADVFVLPAHRGQGLSTWLIDTIIAHPDLQGLRRWMLATRDAHALYARVGFEPLKTPERFMVIHDPDVYKRGA